MIDVEPTNGNKSSLGRAIGCMAKSLPVLLLAFFLLTGAVWLAFRYLVPQEEATMETAKAVDSTPPGSGGGSASPPAGKSEEVPEEAIADSEGADPTTLPAKEEVEASILAYERQLKEQGVAAAERGRLVREKYGPQAEALGILIGGLPAAGEAEPEAGTQPAPLPTDGGYTSTVERNGGQGGGYQKSRGDLSAAGTDLRYELIFQEAGGQLHYRFFLLPFDKQADRLFKQGESYLTLRLTQSSQGKMLPADGPQPLPLAEMVAFERDGRPAGWVVRGILPAGMPVDEIDLVRVGWNFDDRLEGWLKELKQLRAR